MKQFIINLLNPIPMARAKMKTCAISGKQFKADTNNFYVNKSSSDGLHPYHKSFDNFRRASGMTPKQMKQFVELINTVK